MKIRKNPIIKVISIIMTVVILINVVGIGLNAFTELSAYKNAIVVYDEEWKSLLDKMRKGIALSDDEYYTVFTQTGLGKTVVKDLITTGNVGIIEYYREYYTREKSYECVREDFLSHHEYVTDKYGNRIVNPDFIGLQNGDILITLSMHSYGWRHGHCAIVTDAKSGQTVQAIRMGVPSGFGHISEWRRFPLVAVLRAKNLDANQRNNIAIFAKNDMIDIEYSLLAGVFDGRDTNEPLKTTQCAHLVWYAYMKFGIDIDSNGGAKTTPRDILKSEELEVVQVYGNIMEM